MDNIIEITIEPRHFAEAKSDMDLYECPLGLAIREQFNTRKYIVGGHTVDIMGKTYKIPMKLMHLANTREAIRNAKEGRKVKSLTVELHRLYENQRDNDQSRRYSKQPVA